MTGPTTSQEGPDLSVLWAHALPADAPGAWLRSAIEAQTQPKEE